MNRNTFFVLFLLISNLVSGQDLKLWYSQPAQNWSEALPIGNSRLGAMVYGGIEREELQLNEETFWAGSPYNNNPNAVHVLPVVRKLIFEGRNKEAQRLIDANFLTQQHGMSYLTLGSLYLEFPEHQNGSGFYRDLNLENATTTTRYQVDDVTYTRTTFASFTDNVIIMHIKASKANALNFTIAYNCPLVHKVNVQNDQLTVTCQGKEQEGLKAALRAGCQIQVKTNGTLRPGGNTLQINEGTEATLYISAATNYVNYQDVSADESHRTSEYLKRAMQIPYEKALKSHIAYYKKQFDRVRLTLPTGKTSQLETPKRIENFGNGEDMAMAALLFHYGRYLLISSSQPGGQPANLQGIWNNSTHAPWDSKYTININTEMNYWPAEVTNLSETHSPLFSMLKDLSVTGAETARTMYDCRGWMAHHNTDLWRICGVVDFAAAGMWPSGGAWLAQHIWQHYLFTGDKEKARAFCGFKEVKPVILIVGGSLGAVAVNNAVRKILPELLKDFQVVHLCGKGKLDEKLTGLNGYVQFEYIQDELKDLFALADVVISRAGANAICELLALRKPNLLIPLSANASRGDQILNARSFEKQGFSMVLEEEEITDEKLLDTIHQLYDNRHSFEEAMSAGKQMDSIHHIVSLIEECVLSKK